MRNAPVQRFGLDEPAQLLGVDPRREHVRAAVARRSRASCRTWRCGTAGRSSGTRTSASISVTAGRSRGPAPMSAVWESIAAFGRPVERRGVQRAARRRRVDAASGVGARAAGEERLVARPPSCCNQRPRSARAPSRAGRAHGVADLVLLPDDDRRLEVARARTPARRRDWRQLAGQKDRAELGRRAAAARAPGTSSARATGCGRRRRPRLPRARREPVRPGRRARAR